MGLDKNLGRILVRYTTEVGKMLKRQPKFWIFFGLIEGRGENSDFLGRVVYHYLFNKNIQNFTLSAHAIPTWPVFRSRAGPKVNRENS